jgi:glycosyltransferase involved in cell wall biosynthesis
MLSIRVTICLCVKNCVKTVKAAVESVLEQNFPHKLMEIIVVDGESKDGTVNAIRDVLLRGDIVYKIFIDQVGGLGHARQLAVNNAKGEYVVWVDGDLMLSSGYVQVLTRVMDENQELGGVKGIDGDITRQYELMRKLSRYYRRTLVADLEFLSRLPYRLPFRAEHSVAVLSTNAGMFRITAIKAAGGFNSRIKGAGEDVELSLRIRSLGWLFSRCEVAYYQTFRTNWMDFWRRYFWYGRGIHIANHISKGILDTSPSIRMPPAAFVVGLSRTRSGYERTGKKIAFLLPILCVIRDLAWCFGYFSAHLEGYGHGISQTAMSRSISSTLH